MKVIIKKPGKNAVTRNIPNSLAALRRIVGGKIGTCRVMTDVTAIMDGEGRLKGKPINIFGLYGTLVFAGRDITGFTDLPSSAYRLFFGDNNQASASVTSRNRCIHCKNEVIEWHLECGACEAKARQ